MKRLGLGMGLLVLVSGCGLGRGCGPARAISGKPSLASELDPSEYRLTDEDVQKYIKDMPELAKEYQALERAARGPLGGLTALPKAKGLLDKLRAMGWQPPERFFAVQFAIMTALAYSSAAEHRGDLERAIEDPNLPPEVRKQIREMLTSTEPPNEVVEHNIKVVAKYRKELDQLHRSLGF